MMCSAPAVTYRRDIDWHWVRLYVQARESIDPETVQAKSRLLAVLDAPEIGPDRAEFRDEPNRRDCAATNLDRIEVVVGSVGFPADDQAMVRFTTYQLDTSTGRREPLGSWTATIGYAYVVPPLSVEDRRLNPWGFQVRRYRVQSEAAASASSASAFADRGSLATGECRP